MKTRIMLLFLIPAMAAGGPQSLPSATGASQSIADQLKIPNAPKTARTLAPFRQIQPNMTMVDVVRLCGVPDEYEDFGGGGTSSSYHLSDGSTVIIIATHPSRLDYVQHVEISGKNTSLIERAPRDNSIPGATPETFFGGSDNLRLVTEAKTISVFRIVDPDQNTKGRKSTTIDHVDCDPSPSTVSGPEIGRLIGALSDMNNFGGPFVCTFSPGVIFRFGDVDHNLDLLICFHCDEMILYKDGVVVRRPFEWAKVKNTFLTNAYLAFAAVAKKAFPDDPEIRALKQ